MLTMHDRLIEGLRLPTIFAARAFLGLRGRDAFLLVIERTISDVALAECNVDATWLCCAQLGELVLGPLRP